MYAFGLRAAAVALVAGVGLTGCMSPYGYNGVSVGVGNGGYYGDYGYGYGGYPQYGYGYGAGYAPYYGWYDDFYYPGSGYYVYDRYRRPHRWTDAQRRYWESRRTHAMSSKEFRRQMEAQKQNWDGFGAGPTAAPQQVQTSDGERVRVQRERPVRGDRANRADRVRRADQTEAVQQDNQVERVQRTERSRPERAQRSERQNSREFRSSMSGRSRAADNSDSSTKED